MAHGACRYTPKASSWFCTSYHPYNKNSELPSMFQRQRPRIIHEQREWSGPIFSSIQTIRTNISGRYQENVSVDLVYTRPPRLPAYQLPRASGQTSTYRGIDKTVNFFFDPFNPLCRLPLFMFGVRPFRGILVVPPLATVNRNRHLLLCFASIKVRLLQRRSRHFVATLHQPVLVLPSSSLHI